MLKRVLHILLMTLGGLAVAGILGFLFGYLVMLLWNWLMPAIFGLKTVTFWQAWGLVILSHLLFKTMHPHDSHHHKRDRVHRSKLAERIHEHLSHECKDECCKDNS